MLQPWLNEMGLAADFVGAMLLAREWWIAFGAEQREDEIMERQRREDELMQFAARSNPTPNPSHAAFERMREQQRFTQYKQRVNTARGMRRAWFMTALGLLAFGFLLQMAGSWPGLGR